VSADNILHVGWPALWKIAFPLDYLDTRYPVCPSIV